MIGSNLVRRLASLGNRPFLLMRDPMRLVRFAEVRNLVTPILGDITDAAAVTRAVRESQPDVVFHLASSYFNPPTLTIDQHMATNVSGTLNLSEALKDQKGVRLVYAGTCAVYADDIGLTENLPLRPSSIFGVSKACASIIVGAAARQYGLHSVELRLFTPFGPWENVRRLIPDTIMTALADHEMEIGHGGQKRDFVYMDDVIDAFLLAAERPIPPASVYNIASGVGRPIRDVVTRILELMGNPVPLRIGVRPTRADEIWEISADVSAAARDLGWRPRVDFDDGLRKTIDWFRENRSLAPILV